MHGLRLKGFAEPAAVAELVGLPEDVVVAHLADMEAAGLAQHREGRLSGYVLTPDGRGEHERLLSAELDGAGGRDAIHAAYVRFLSLNAELLTVCTAWQLRDVAGQSVINDHTDEAHDKEVIGRLEDLDARVQPICASLADALGRFSAYGPRLSEAVAKVRAGEIQFFTKPMIPSYHTIWFELHEDLLATLGIDRGSEGSET
jgi:hypothetical protein